MSSSDGSGGRLDRLIRLLPSPAVQLHGKCATPRTRADNIVCFSRTSASELNRPQRGRALHHRFVLILALRTGATVCVDDCAVALHAGEALLVFPFQFHDYMNPEREELLWCFVTFDLAEAAALEVFRYRPFRLSAPLQRLARQLIRAYLLPGHDDLAVAVFAHLLECIKLVEPIERAQPAALPHDALLTQVNHLMLRSQEACSTKEMAAAIGISESHLRARFRESCGVSLGRHLRRLRLEQACGMLRLSDRRISEIAELCGFASVFSFSRAFHQAYGMAPRDYRREGGPAVPQRPGATAASG